MVDSQEMEVQSESSEQLKIAKMWTSAFNDYERDSAAKAAAFVDVSYRFVDQILSEYDIDLSLDIADLRNELIAIILETSNKKREYAQSTVTRCRVSMQQYLEAQLLLAEETNRESAFPNLAEDEQGTSAVLEEDRPHLKNTIDMVLQSLTYREREIIKLRYGLKNGFTYTLEEVGEIFNVTANRVSEIEYKAMRKLQHPTRRVYLANFL